MTRSLPAHLPQEGPTCARSFAQTRNKAKCKPSPQDILERYKTCTVRDVELRSTETDEDVEAIDPPLAGGFWVCLLNSTNLRCVII